MYLGDTGEGPRAPQVSYKLINCENIHEKCKISQDIMTPNTKLHFVSKHTYV
jgi:hypothetical protein